MAVNLTQDASNPLWVQWNQQRTQPGAINPNNFLGWMQATGNMGPSGGGLGASSAYDPSQVQAAFTGATTPYSDATAGFYGSLYGFTPTAKSVPVVDPNPTPKSIWAGVPQPGQPGYVDPTTGAVTPGTPGWVPGQTNPNGTPANPSMNQIMTRNTGGNVTRTGGTPAGGAPTGDNFNLNATPQGAGSSAIPLPTSSSGYALDPSKYVNPNEQYLQDWLMHDLASQYGSEGGMLSGAAGRGLQTNAAQLAQSSSWLPALQTATQQQGTAINLDQANRQFDYQAMLNDETIPFGQKMQLAQLGLQGTQAQQSVANLLATLISQNAANAGAATGAGTQGGSTAINQAVASIINQLNSGTSLASILKAFGLG